MRNRPKLKRTAVTKAPRQTSRQHTRTSGSTLNKSANNTVISASPTTRSAPRNTQGATGIQPWVEVTTAVSTVVRTRELKSRNPTTNTIANEIKRCMIITVQPLRLGFAVTPQMAFNESCNCPNTVVAPSMRIPMPTAVATQPLSSNALASIAF